MRCPHCGYQWESRIPSPKECPRCKARLNYFVAGAPEKRKGGVRIRVTPRTWGTVAVIIIVAGIGAYALWPREAPAVGPEWRPVVSMTPGSVEPAVAGNSYIENIYLMKSTAAGYTYDLTTNLSGHENLLAVYTREMAAADTPLDIAYNTKFDIVVAVKAHDDNLANIVRENVKVEFAVTSIAGALKRDGVGIGAFAENSDDTDEYQFGLTATYIQLNALKGTWDNFELTAGSSFNFSVKLWCWG